MYHVITTSPIDTPSDKLTVPTVEHDGLLSFASDIVIYTVHVVAREGLPLSLASNLSVYELEVSKSRLLIKVNRPSDEPTRKELSVLPATRC